MTHSTVRASTSPETASSSQVQRRYYHGHIINARMPAIIAFLHQDHYCAICHAIMLSMSKIPSQHPIEVSSMVACRPRGARDKLHARHAYVARV